MLIGDKIKRKREDVGLSRDHMAAVLNVDPRTYEQIENNKREPKLSEIDKIAEEFRITPLELQYGEPRLVFENCNQHGSVYGGGTVNYQNPETLKAEYEKRIAALERTIQDKDEIIKLKEQLIDMQKVKK